MFPYRMLQEILRLNGALELADPNIMQPLSMLPDNYQDIISNAGGLRPILEQSGKFLFDGNRVMLPEDKEFEDFVKTFKPKPSNNPFLERTVNGTKNTDANCQNGTQDSKSMLDDDSVMAEKHDNGAPDDLSFPTSSSPPLNPGVKEFLSSSQTDSLTISSSKTSLASADSTLKDVESVDDQMEDEKDTIVIQQTEQTLNGKTEEESVLESDRLSETTKKTVETQQDDLADISSGISVSIIGKSSSIDGKNFEDSSCDLTQAILPVEPVEKGTVAPAPVEDTAPIQTSNHKLDGTSSSSETVITSKTKAVQTQPNVKSKGVGTDPIPEPFKAEYQRAAADKEALQARLQENTDRHNALLNKNTAECEKVKKKLADALQEKEVNILENAKALLRAWGGTCENLFWVMETI